MMKKARSHSEGGSAQCPEDPRIFVSSSPRCVHSPVSFSLIAYPSTALHGNPGYSRASALSMAATANIGIGWLKTMGGLIFSTLPNFPSPPTSTPSSRIRFEQAVHHVSCGFLAGAVMHQFHAGGEADAAHVADQRMLWHQASQALAEIGADVRAFSSSLSSRITSSTAMPAAPATLLPPKVEKNGPSLKEMRQDLGPGDHHAQRIAIAGGLADGDEVRRHAMVAVAPERGPMRPKPDCTSSAMNSPPALRTRATMPCR